MILRPAPPSAHALSVAFGLPVPDSLVRLASALHAWAAGDPGRLQRAERALGFFPAGALETCLCSGRPWGDARYPQTPPELLVIGATGVDGAHFGLLVHAPDLPTDWPLADLCPMDDDGVVLVGSTLIEGLAAQLHEAESLDDPDAEAIAHFRAALRIAPGPPPPPAPLAVPDGWAFVPSPDGVGTLAPRDAFRELPLAPAPDPLARALADLRDGFAGAALARLRDAWWHDWARQGARLSEPMALAYEALARPLFARIARERAARLATL